MKPPAPRAGAPARGNRNARSAREFGDTTRPAAVLCVQALPRGPPPVGAGWRHI